MARVRREPAHTVRPSGPILDLPPFDVFLRPTTRRWLNGSMNRLDLLLRPSLALSTLLLGVACGSPPAPPATPPPAPSPPSAPEAAPAEGDDADRAEGRKAPTMVEFLDNVDELSEFRTLVGRCGSTSLFGRSSNLAPLLPMNDVFARLPAAEKRRLETDAGYCRRVVAWPAAPVELGTQWPDAPVELGAR